MSAVYYPLSRVKTGLYTSGGTFYLNGVPYKGPYYLTYKGEAYTGSDPVVGTNQPLTTKASKGSTSQTARGGEAGIDEKYSPIDTTPPTKDQLLRVPEPAPKLRLITSYFPIVLESDYKRGYFVRYFAKRIVDKGYIIEISYQDWANIENKEDPSFEEYEIESLMWQLTGPLKDTRISQYQIKGGVYDTNRRITIQKAKNFSGLIEFIGGDYIKFARISG